MHKVLRYDQALAVAQIPESEGHTIRLWWYTFLVLLVNVVVPSLLLGLWGSVVVNLDCGRKYRGILTKWMASSRVLNFIVAPCM
jgi:hypothetical protein